MNIGNYLNEVKEKKPLIHNITNYVTANDVANIELACGASPIMSDELAEMNDLSKNCDVLNVNIGTINSNTLVSMIEAVTFYKKLEKPIIIDMVGIGASTFRYQAVLQLLGIGGVKVIKGNSSEIETLFSKKARGRGVDATNYEKDLCVVEMCKSLAVQYNCLIVCTGKKDIVTNGDKVITIENGCFKMSQITGSGCQLTGLIAAFLACDDSVECIVCAVAMMSIAGELANQKNIGNSTYRNELIDNIYFMNQDVINREIKYEVK